MGLWRAVPVARLAGTMHSVGERKCLHCERFFTPDARNRRRRHYCAKEPCRRASKTASQRRWLSRPENADYFQGVDNAARVRAWQAAHPGYRARAVFPAPRPQPTGDRARQASLPPTLPLPPGISSPQIITAPLAPLRGRSPDGYGRFGAGAIVVRGHPNQAS